MYISRGSYLSWLFLSLFTRWITDGKNTFFKKKIFITKFDDQICDELFFFVSFVCSSNMTDQQIYHSSHTVLYSDNAHIHSILFIMVVLSLFTRWISGGKKNFFKKKFIITKFNDDICDKLFFFCVSFVYNSNITINGFNIILVPSYILGLAQWIVWTL